MVKTKFFLLVAAVLMAGAVAFFFFFQSDAHRIKKQFARLAETAEKTESETELEAGIAARRISSMFAESCRIEAPGRNISGNFAPNDIAAYVTNARRQYDRIEVDFFDIEIEFPEEKKASVSFTAAFSGTKPNTKSTKDIHEIACRMKKNEGDWVFYEIRVVSVLKRQAAKSSFNF
ncbi:MAG: hypothetical protein ACQERN_12820 [Thermodesulfobacteriota bacterium]